MMREETITRLRNAFAQVALDWIEGPPSSPERVVAGLPFSTMSEADCRQAVTLWREYAATILDGVVDRNCPACGGEQSRFLFVSYDAHAFHQCETCGCWFAPKFVDASVFERLFELSPSARSLAADMLDVRDRDAGREADMKRIGEYLDELMPMLPATGGPAYLDVGCGVGHSLRAGSARGLRVYGIEADQTAVSIARAAGLPVAGLEEPVPGGPFHLISFWETLEHVADPLAAIERCLPALDADGLVAITVPNLNALASRGLREACAWVHGGYNTPGHINLFNVAAIERLLNRAGLVLLDADGQFSGNPLELAAYLGGTSRGAFDTLGRQPGGELPQALTAVLAGGWPGVALVERLALLSPVLRVVACRRGREARFADAVAGRRASRKAALAAEARALIAGEPDYRTMAEDLQREVDARDALLRATVTDLQGEIMRRDQLLRTTVTEMQGEVDRRQGEIDRRDTLLEQVRADLSATVDARLRRALNRTRRTIFPR